MSFLQPWLLPALALASLPIIIHLINQRRYQTTRWAAMMFLLAANRMSRGYARLRQWLIMAMRVAAIAALVFAVSRPLAGGRLVQAAGGRPDATFLLIDRSPSMQQRGLGSAGSKLETGLRRLAGTLKTIGSTRWLVVEGGTNRIRPLETIDGLTDSAGVDPASAPADIPAMLTAVKDHIKANKLGRTEVWILSDVREDDWDVEGGRWRTVRDAFLEFPQAVRIRLLAYAQPAPGNVAVRVTDCRRRDTPDGAELLVSLKLSREGGDGARKTVPVQFDIEGARSVVNVELAGASHELKDHRIPLDRSKVRGWGRVSIPADDNPADDEFWFVFDRPAPRKALIVSDDARAARPLQLAASIAPDPAVRCSAEILGPDALGSVEWDDLALVAWHAPLPDGDTAKRLQSVLDRGGQVLFLPAKAPGSGRFAGVGWGEWKDGPGDAGVVGWRGDQDLLAATQSGSALPLGELSVRRVCGLTGEFTALATLKGGTSLLARVPTDAGGLYFLATSPAPGDSNLAGGGVVFYVMIQRALAAGSASLGGVRAMAAGAKPMDDPTRWARLAGGEEAVSTDYAIHRGVYRSGDRLIAVNRPQAEDGAPILADDRVEGLFRGLDFARVDDRAGTEGSLVQEVWRAFLAAMLIALVAEAGLCLPKRPAPAEAAAR